MFQWLTDFINQETISIIHNKLSEKCKTELSDELSFLQTDITNKMHNLNKSYNAETSKLLYEEEQLKIRLHEINKTKEFLQQNYSRAKIETLQPINEIINKKINSFILSESLKLNYNIENKFRKSNFDDMQTTLDIAKYISINNHWYFDDSDELSNLMNYLISENHFTFDQLKIIVFKCVCYHGTIYNKNNHIWSDFIFDQQQHKRARMNAIRNYNFSDCYSFILHVITINSTCKIYISHEYSEPIIVFNKNGPLNIVDNKTPDEYIDSLLESF